jgi:hypothetical protein
MRGCSDHWTSRNMSCMPRRVAVCAAQAAPICAHICHAQDVDSRNLPPRRVLEATRLYSAWQTPRAGATPPDVGSAVAKATNFAGLAARPRSSARQQSDLKAASMAEESSCRTMSSALAKMRMLGCCCRSSSRGLWRVRAKRTGSSGSPWCPARLAQAFTKRRG